jgi:uncharacterized protein involved in exopolysaccharide biosynthesis
MAREPDMAVPARDSASGELSANSPLLSIRFVLNALRRRWLTVLTVAALVTAPVVALLLVTPPRYTANAQIMVDPRELRIVRNDVTPEAGTNETATTLVESHARIVSSDNVLMRVIERQNLGPASHHGRHAQGARRRRHEGRSEA